MPDQQDSDDGGHAAQPAEEADRDGGNGDALNVGVPAPARRYNAWLGGKDNFAADRAGAEDVAKAFETIVSAAIENRRFLQRAVHWLATEAGIRQYLDIGCGLPVFPNVHDVAQDIAAESRVLYVDRDIEVMTHARALLRSHPDGVTEYVHADLADPKSILAATRQTLDPEQPIGLLLVAVLHFIPGDQAHEIVAELVDALPVGSHLVVSHATGDWMPPAQAAEVEAAVRRAGPFQLRGREDIERFFAGLHQIDPGVAPVSVWRRGDDPAPPAADVSMWAGIGVKP